MIKTLWKGSIMRRKWWACQTKGHRRLWNVLDRADLPFSMFPADIEFNQIVHNIFCRCRSLIICSQERTRTNNPFIMDRGRGGMEWDRERGRCQGLVVVGLWVTWFTVRVRLGHYWPSVATEPGGTVPPPPHFFNYKVIIKCPLIHRKGAYCYFR